MTVRALLCVALFGCGHSEAQVFADAPLPVSITALYDKLGGVEMATTEALVAYSAERLRPVVAGLCGSGQLGMQHLAAQLGQLREEPPRG
ncbi:MAG TPA: hypothetical protein VF331_03740 [Polyangiales bacterium]